MRSFAALLVGVAACASDPTPTVQPATDPVDEVWAKSIHAGDVVVLVPGTGAYDFLAATIEPMAGDHPIVDVREVPKVESDAIVFEQAIAAAKRAGVAPTSLTFLLWGSGFTRLTGFEYVSYEGIHVPIEILGGKHSCAVGLVTENLLNYTQQNVAADADDLNRRTQVWLDKHPTPAPRNVLIASHSWGGAIAEWLVFHHDDAVGSLTVAMGVPGWVPGYNFAGPSFLDVNANFLLEIDRPDDPVHAMNPSGNGEGHQYDITNGDLYLGSYGITTDEMSCLSVPGPCGDPPPHE